MTPIEFGLLVIAIFVLACLALINCRLRLDLETKATQLRAHAAHAKDLNDLLQRRAERIDDLNRTITRLTDDKVRLQGQVDSAKANIAKLNADLSAANDRILEFEDAAAARQAQRVAAAKRAAIVNHENALKRKALKSGAAVAAKAGG